jgi:hypothetical protein
MGCQDQEEELVPWKEQRDKQDLKSQKIWPWWGIIAGKFVKMKKT